MPDLPLAHAWIDQMSERFASVPVVGLSGEHARLRIDDVYVPLHFQGTDRDDLLGGRKPSRGATPEPGGRGGPPGPVTIAAALHHLQFELGLPFKRGLALVGAPGAGKTTLLKQVFRQYRCGNLEYEGTPLLGGRLPVYLRLAAHWKRVVPDAGAPATLAQLIETVAEEVMPGAGKELVDSGCNLLVLLDGLDEVPGERERAAVCRWLVDALAGREEWVFVVTCRTAAWRGAGDSLQSTFAHYAVQGFRRPAATRYIQAWFPLFERATVRAGGALDAERTQALASELVDAIYGDTQAGLRLRRMAQNPLLLSVMCLVHRRRGRLPETRALLYKVCLHILLGERYRESERSWAERSVAPLWTPEQAEAALQPVAWQMQQERAAGSDNPDDDDATAISTDALQRALARSLQRPGAPAVDPAGFHIAVEGQGVLESPRIGWWRFSHLTFQEHLAARYAAENTQEAVLASHLGDRWWLETLKLATADAVVARRLCHEALKRELSEEGRSVLVDLLRAHPPEVGLGAVREVLGRAARAIALGTRFGEDGLAQLLAALRSSGDARVVGLLAQLNADAPEPTPRGARQPAQAGDRPPGDGPRCSAGRHVLDGVERGPGLGRLRRGREEGRAPSPRGDHSRALRAGSPPGHECPIQDLCAGHRRRGALLAGHRRLRPRRPARCRRELVRRNEVLPLAVRRIGSHRRPAHRSGVGVGRTRE